MPSKPFIVTIFAASAFQTLLSGCKSDSAIDPPVFEDSGVEEPPSYYAIYNPFYYYGNPFYGPYYYESGETGDTDPPPPETGGTDTGDTGVGDTGAPKTGDTGLRPETSDTAPPADTGDTAARTPTNRYPGALRQRLPEHAALDVFARSKPDPQTRMPARGAFVVTYRRG